MGQTPALTIPNWHSILTGVRESVCVLCCVRSQVKLSQVGDSFSFSFSFTPDEFADDVPSLWLLDHLGCFSRVPSLGTPLARCINWSDCTTEGETATAAEEPAQERHS